MSAQQLRLLDQIDAVLFDLDGTLLDTARDLVHALHSVCDEEGQDKPPVTLAAPYVSTGAVGLVKLAFPQADGSKVERLRHRLVELYEQNICVHTAPYPGITELLDGLQAANIPWGVVTNKMRYLALPIMQQLGLYEDCKVLVGGDTAARSKPHPDPILHALDAMGIAAHRSIYVGDAEKDVIAGNAAGATTIAASWGYIPPEQEAHQWNADYTIDCPGDLLTLTGTLNKN